MRGNFYLYFQSLHRRLFGALVMVGVVMAAARRYLKRPRKLVYTDEAALILAAIFLLCLQGFLVEGWRIAATNDPWGAWSPFGNLVARASRPLMSAEAMRRAHTGVWWFHLAVSFAFLAWLPYTKMMHVLTAPLNIYTASLAPLGASLRNIDFEKTEAFGVNSLKGFTWKDLLDFDACTECGRCTAVCPANTVGKELSPRDIILGLRDLMHERPRDAFGLVAADGDGASAIAPLAGTTPADGASTTDVEERKPLPIIGAVPATSPAPLWQCTTCAACMEACPVFIEQMPKIVDMRRFLVMEEADFPDSMQEAVMSLERRGHPFSGTQATRLDWAEGLNVRHVGEAKDAEVLLWVGCGGALVERNQHVTRATAQLLEQAGVKFAVMGREEKCSGDPARRIGNEFLFETAREGERLEPEPARRQAGRHGLPALLQHLPQRVPAVRRRVRGLSPQRIPRAARRRGQAEAGRPDRQEDHFPRPLLPRAAERRLRRAARAGAASLRAARRSRWSAAASKVSAAAAGAG